MDIFGKFESLVGDWQGKNSLQKRLSALVDEIAACNSLIINGDSLYIDNGRQHVESADRNYRQALQKLKEEEHGACVHFIAKAEIHAHCARLNLTVSDDTPLDPCFADGTAAKLLEQLSESVVKTKLAIEYSNCTVNPRIAKGFRTVVALFLSAVHKLNSGYESDGGKLVAANENLARRIADAGLLLLYSLTKQVNAENQQDVIDVKLPESGIRADKQIKHLADSLYECKRFFLDSGVPVTPVVDGHFYDAEMSLFNSIDSLVDSDHDAVESATAAGLSELDLARKLFQATDPASVQQFKEQPQEEFDERALTRRIESKSKLLKMKDRERFQKHLKAALRFYELAREAMDKGDSHEADRLAKAAWLDLDFSHQMAFSKTKAEYRDI